RHGEILLQHLIGIAADADLRAVAVEGLLTGIPVVRTTRAAATRAPVVWSLSHFPIASGNRPGAPSPRPLRRHPFGRLLRLNRGGYLGTTGAPIRREALPARSVTITLIGFAAVSNRYFFAANPSALLTRILKDSIAVRDSGEGRPDRGAGRCSG